MAKNKNSAALFEVINRGIPMEAISTDQLRNIPPYPNAMEVPRSTGSSPRSGEALANAGELTQAPQISAQAPPAPTSAPLVVHDEKRQVGLNYVIMQSYPD